MKKIYKILLVSCIAIACVTASQAQKLGYINSAALLAELPEVKQAKTNLETLSNQLKKKLENQYADLQRKAEELQKQYQREELSPKEVKTKQAEIGAEEQALAKTQQEMSQQVVKKEQDLLQPILDKINKVIQDVAVENGYTYVFDLSQGVLLYYDPAHDLGEKVKAKLTSP